MPDPIQYSSTEPFESASHPGATFTLRKWSPKRRREYNAKMAPLLHDCRLVDDELSEIYSKARELRKQVDIEPCDCGHAQHFGETNPDTGVAEIKKCPECDCLLPRKEANLDPKDQLAFTRLQAKRNMIENDELQPTRLRWAVASIEGIITDGKPLDVEILIEAGPDTLALEISQKIEEMLFPTPEQIKNSSSPITSHPQVDGATKSTGVDTATNAISGAIATAA